MSNYRTGGYCRFYPGQDWSFHEVIRDEFIFFGDRNLDDMRRTAEAQVGRAGAERPVIMGEQSS